MTGASSLLFVLALLAAGQNAAGQNAAGQNPEPPPLSEEARTRISNLARETQENSARLKSSLERNQQELARIYAEYDLDERQATKLETEIIEQQRQLLANYRRMQVELRQSVTKERFAILKRRLDLMLESAATKKSETPAAAATERTAAAPSPERVQAQQVFSGPQVGEKLPLFKVRGVYDDEAGKEFDFVKEADGKPLVLIFVHEGNRPSIGLTRELTTYTMGRAKDGLRTGLVWLDDDATQAESTLKRIRHALTAGTPTGVSIDGKEGPGSYGLNRGVTLTILVGKEGKVTANFALVQPSIQDDLPKIFKEIVRIAGGEMPKPAQPGPREAMTRPAAAAQDTKLPGLVRAVIQLNLTPEAVEKAATAVEEHVKDNEAARKELGRMSSAVVGGGKLSNYGTARAQEFLKQWAEKYGTKSAPDK